MNPSLSEFRLGDLAPQALASGARSAMAVGFGLMLSEASVGSQNLLDASDGWVGA
jgi:hypothetical protein